MLQTVRAKKVDKNWGHLSTILVIIFWNFYNVLVQIRLTTCKMKRGIQYSNNSRKIRKSRYQTFLDLSSFTGFLYFVPNILFRIVDYMLLSWFMVLKLSKTVHFLQFCAGLSQKPKCVKVIYIHGSESFHYSLSENDMSYKGLSHRSWVLAIKI